MPDAEPNHTPALEGASTSSQESEVSNAGDDTRKQQLMHMLDRLHMQTGDQAAPDPHTRLGAQGKVHQFWSTQPVPQEAIPVDVVPGPIQEDLLPERIRQTPYPLPKEFEWVDIDVEDDEQFKCSLLHLPANVLGSGMELKLNSRECRGCVELAKRSPLLTAEGLYTLLNLNYNEDVDGMFRFDYSTDFLRWALLPPGYRKCWHFGVRAAVSKKLVAFISAIPVQMRVLDAIRPMVEINFLCIHKKLRAKRLAPVLIKEVTRRSNLQGFFQAIYTAGTRIPTPIAVCPYFHRTLNPKKLVEVGFTSLPRGVSLAKRIAHDALPAKPPLALRLMEERDLPQVRDLYNRFQRANTKLGPVYDSDELAKHWLLPIPDVLWTYVVEGPGGRLSDFVSFYCLDSSVLKHATHRRIHAAYLYYYGSTYQDAMEQDFHVRLQELVQSALVMAKQLGFDVFNGIDCAQNSKVFAALKFAQGDGALNYYLFNWQCPALGRPDIGLIMV
ncbi:glycylpeptide N-tetradecanoyltransferase [Massospora cicadina]|nr:glycylpeptide N-tetradecanoyltransferase [Massospora cicadina]